MRQEKTTSPRSGYFHALDSSLFQSTRQGLGYVHPGPGPLCEFAVTGGVYVIGPPPDDNLYMLQLLRACLHHGLHLKSMLIVCFLKCWRASRAIFEGLCCGVGEQGGPAGSACKSCNLLNCGGDLGLGYVGKWIGGRGRICGGGCGADLGRCWGA